MKAGRSRAARCASGACALLSVVVMSGCGNSDTAGDDHVERPHTPLITALSQVKDTHLTQDWIEFGDVAGVRARSGAGSASPRDPLLGYGEQKLADAAALLPGLTGIDPFAARTALTLGYPPDQVGVLYGSFNTTEIGAKLRKLGYKEHALAGGETSWIIRDHHQIDQKDPLAQLGILTALNVVRVSSKRIVHAGATADIDKTLSGARSLSDNEEVGGIADCLGQVEAAQIGFDVNISDTPLGVGVLRPSGSDADATEVACVTTESEGAAQALASGWPGRVKSTMSARAGEPWSKLLTRPRAEVVGGASHVVRLTARPTGSPRVLFDEWAVGDLGPVLTGAKPDPRLSAKPR
ncbi:hypothetical protein [Streptomyces sp. SID13726]|uniref:hypothetical protein n=1 Tax=Streptomyces sp. SID13726 TaxID=2706058 RepID=UPI0013B608A8|nr:hypothetical protein [Streptomyces sp. SID13726]NEA97631.1 hypothetical protein [Streptomyces sp. SID13726]